MTNFIPTIVIVADPQADIRGFSLQGREFVLFESSPRFDEGISLDGIKLLDKHWVVSIKEFLRVVPEWKHDFKSETVYIPVHLARLSFRPAYLAKLS
jgi:hypothetical protein